MRFLATPSGSTAATVLWLLACGIAQEPVRPLTPEPPCAAVVTRWLDSEQLDRKQLDATIAAVLADGEAGLVWLGATLREAAARPADARRAQLDQFATKVVLAFVKEQIDSGMVYAGQYAPLAPLQPFVGKLLFQLVLATPDWFADTRRLQLVPALRDLEPRPPEPPVLDAVMALADDVDEEPEDLRVPLMALLWQWGHKERAQGELDRWQRATSEGDAEDRVLAYRRLAELQYLLREYRAAAATFTRLEMMAKSARLDVTPTDLYTAACVHALVGDKDLAFQALEKCASMQASPKVDSSLKLSRKLFERDPELASLRADPRFAAIVAKAFGGAATGRDGTGRDDTGRDGIGRDGIGQDGKER